MKERSVYNQEMLNIQMKNTVKIIELMIIRLEPQDTRAVFQALLIPFALKV